MALTPQEAFGQLEIGHARLLALFDLFQRGEISTESELDAWADQLDGIAGSLIEAWATLLLDGRAIGAMRDTISHLGQPERAAS